MEGICAKCNEFKEVHKHHLIPKSAGGKRLRHNTMLLCVDCHKAFHSKWGTGNSYLYRINKEYHHKKAIEAVNSLL